ncbi:unnamed protein product [Cuscuta campestris]|uniref:Uncharacterized protein n=1 Tax=Cuscuta campestris TaxID=132261 RepID=A0A484LR13_9ASTE|nr:unnamed protein product [Cuscuta campestris]
MTKSGRQLQTPVGLDFFVKICNVFSPPDESLWFSLLRILRYRPIIARFSSVGVFLITTPTTFTLSGVSLKPRAAFESRSLQRCLHR